MEHIEKFCSLESKLFLISIRSIRILNILKVISKFAQPWYKVILKDAGLDGLDAGSKNINDALQKKVKRKKMSQWDADIIKERLKPTLDYSQIANSDVIIEAVPEILDLKHRVSLYVSSFID